MKRNDVKWNLPSRYHCLRSLYIEFLSYTVRKQIGSGAYGDVVAAYDHEEDKYVAVKRFADIFSDVIDCKRMLREISILSQYAVF